MERLRVNIKNTIYDLDLTHNKFIVGNDYELKESIILTIKGYFNKESSSDYAIENNYNNLLYIDETILNRNDFDFYYLGQQFDLNFDLKITSKSIIQKYVESKLLKIEFNENYQTLIIVYNSFIECLNTIIQDDFSDISLKIKSIFEKKQMLKLLDVIALKDELEVNNYDLSIDDKIILQLEMLKSVIKDNKKVIVILETFCFSQLYLKKIKEFNRNVYFIIFCEKCEDINIGDNNFVLANKNFFIDINNDDQLYELCMDYNKNVTIEDMRLIMMDMVKDMLKL